MRVSIIGLFHPIPKGMILKLSIAIFIATFMVLYLLQPFDIVHGNTFSGILRLGSYALAVSATFWFMENYLRLHVLSQKPWQVLLWYLTEVLCIATTVFICRTIWMGWGSFSIDSYFLVMIRVLAITAIFLVIAFLFHLLFGVPQESPIELQSDEKNAIVLKLSVENILALTNEKNYTTVYYLSEGLCKEELLRGSLNHFERQLDFPIVRLHRSHMINLKQIERVEGNSQGKELTLKHLKKVFKVSRKNLSTLETSLKRL